MSEKFETYREGHKPDKKTNRLWPLYGAGLENFGKMICQLKFLFHPLVLMSF